MKTKGKTIVKGERRNTADQRKTIRENERGNMLTIERVTIARSKRNHEIKPKQTQQNLQQGGPKTKKAPTSRRDYFKVF